MTVTSFNRTNHRFISDRIAQLLAPLEAEFGIKIDMHGGTLGGSEAIFKVRGVVKDQVSGQVISVERQSFARYCTSYGLQPGDIDRKFIHKRDSYQLVGLSPNRPKYPFDVIRLHDGQRMKFPRDLIVSLLSARRAA